jgi:hypothetical protein
MPADAATAKPRPVPPPKPAWFAREKILRSVRGLIWVYFFLLIFEGALRKWALPQLSDPLLIIRDPVVILIYLFAIKARVFPLNRFMSSLAIIAMLCWIEGILILLPYVPINRIVLVTGYGFRSNFLHLPLIFVLPAVFNSGHVKRLGWWVIVGMIPMSVLMAIQFHESPESFINRAVGLGEGQQIQTGGGKIRPPGTFSFISGAIHYLSAATAFLLHAALSKVKPRNWLLLASGLSLVVAVGVSGSRSAVVSVGLVVASLVVILVVRPEAMTKFGRILLLTLIVAWALSYVPIFHEGVAILSDRFTESAQEADTTIVRGMALRVFESLFEGFGMLDRIPLFGYGLGIGTNGGARFLVGRAVFLLSENEWSRILLESGPIFGMAFLLWRLLLGLRIGYLAFRQLTAGRTLPLFLFSAGFFALLNGPFGQPTTVGFAVMLMGLCLAACQPESDADAASATALAKLPPRMAETRVRGRSTYAARMHETTDANDHPNDSVDR